VLLLVMVLVLVLARSIRTNHLQFQQMALTPQLSALSVLFSVCFA
jgi:hypothetical protein